MKFLSIFSFFLIFAFPVRSFMSKFYFTGKIPINQKFRTDACDLITTAFLLNCNEILKLGVHFKNHLEPAQ